MGQVVFAWEFGGGLGHIEYILPLAKTLQDRGHNVICIMKYVINAEKILGRYGIKVIQAPVFFDISANLLPNTSNYSENLYNLGYHVEDGMISMVKAWRNIFDLIRPDLLVVDHAPTALIAARDTSFKKILYGTGFFSPPQQNPLPHLIPWVEVPEERLKDFDKKVLRITNNALTHLGASPLERLADLFDVDENILATFKELDHYENREPSRYWGPVISLSKGIIPNWPAHYQKKIFCYFKPDNPHFDRLLQALKQIEAAIIIFAPNTPGEVIKKLQHKNLVFLQEPVNMHKVCEECDLVICPAGHGTVVMALLHGTPLLVFPTPNHLEQVLMSRNVALLKVGGAVVNVLKNSDAYKRIILMVLSEPQYLKKARVFAEKYKNFNPELQIAEIADRCEELINQFN